jgi:hypothetical protein
MNGYGDFALVSQLNESTFNNLKDCLRVNCVSVKGCWDDNVALGHSIRDEMLQVLIFHNQCNGVGRVWFRYLFRLLNATPWNCGYRCWPFPSNQIVD